MNLCIVNRTILDVLTVPRKTIKACSGKGGGPLSHLENGHASLFSTGLGSPCEFVHCRHNTWILWAEICIRSDTRKVYWLLRFFIGPASRVPGTFPLLINTLSWNLSMINDHWHISLFPAIEQTVYISTCYRFVVLLQFNYINDIHLQCYLLIVILLGVWKSCKLIT